MYFVLQSYLCQDQLSRYDKLPIVARAPERLPSCDLAARAVPTMGSHKIEAIRTDKSPERLSMTAKLLGRILPAAPFIA
jgi:hypothetical protein